MAKHIFVRPIRSGDAEKVVEWSRSTPNNEFDPKVIMYPSTVVWCAYDDQGPIVYQPLQQPLFMDAQAVNPNRSDLDVSMAMKELTQNAVTQAHLKGVGEIYFLGTDPKANEFAERQLFEKLPWPVYRVKLSDLE